MKRILPVLLFASFAGVAGQSLGQSADTAAEPVRTNPTATEVQGESGPVTVNAGQPAVVPNTTDYQVKVADLDSNHDGVITAGEVPASHALSSEFKLVDRNHDGRITTQELANWH